MGILRWTSRGDALGRMTEAYALLDFTLHAVIWTFVEDQEIGRILTYRVPMGRRETMIQQIALHKFGKDHPDYKALKEGTDKARAAREARNGIVHSMIMSAGRRRDFLVSLKERKIALGEPAGVGEIRAVFNDIKAALELLRPYMEHVDIPVDAPVD